MATQAITSEIAPAINSNQASPGVNANSNTVIMLQGQEMNAEDVVINTVVSGVVQEVFEGQMSAQAIENLAANAVGTEVGDAVGSEIESSQIQPRAQTNTPQSMPQQNVFERIIGDIETEITSAIDDIKELFDPKLVAPTAQKPAPSIAKKMSRQGIFAQRVNSENDDGIDLTLNPSYDKLNPAQLGKGLNLSDGTVSGSGVSRVPTTRQYSELERMDAAAQVGISDTMGWTSIGTTGMNGLEKANYLFGDALGILGRVFVPELKFVSAVMGASNENNVTTIRQNILSNVSETRTAINSSNFPVLLAKESQFDAGYNPDQWVMTTLNKGDVVFGGLPGQSAFYTDESTVINFGDESRELFQSLQVAPDLVRGYRPAVGMYEVQRNIRVPYSITAANPALGPGGGGQFFIQSFDTTLVEVDRINLGESYENNMSSYRFRH